MTDNAYDSLFGSSLERLGQYEYHLALDCTSSRLMRWGISAAGVRTPDVDYGTVGLSLALVERGADCLGADLKEERVTVVAGTAVQYGAITQFLVGDVLKTDSFGTLDLAIVSGVVEHLVTFVKRGSSAWLVPGAYSSRPEAVCLLPDLVEPFAGHREGRGFAMFAGIVSCRIDGSKCCRRNRLRPGHAASRS